MKITIAVLLVATTSSALAADYVRGHVRRDGTYVAPHYRSSPDGNPHNNYSTQGNVNPYTGRTGTVDPLTIQTPGVPTYSPPNFGITTNPYDIINGK